MPRSPLPRRAYLHVKKTLWHHDDHIAPDIQSLRQWNHDPKDTYLVDDAKKQYYDAPCGFYDKVSYLHDLAENDCHTYINYINSEAVINSLVRDWNEVEEKLTDE